MAVDFTRGELLLDLGDRQRADLILVDDEMPDRIVATASTTATFVAVVVDTRVFLLRSRRCSFGCTCTASNDDDVAALLAANFEDLALNLVVANRVLGLAGVTDDLHAVSLFRGSHPTTPK